MNSPTIIAMGRRLRPLEPVTVIGGLLYTSDVAPRFVRRQGGRQPARPALARSSFPRCCPALESPTTSRWMSPMSEASATMRPCDPPCGRWCGCKEIECETCALAQTVIVPGEPGRDEESIPDVLGAPDPDVRVSPR